MVIKELPAKLLNTSYGSAWLPKVKYVWRGEKVPEQDPTSLSAGQCNSRQGFFHRENKNLHKLKSWFSVGTRGAHPSRKALAPLPGQHVALAVTAPGRERTAAWQLWCHRSCCFTELRLVPNWAMMSN